MELYLWDRGLGQLTLAGREEAVVVIVVTALRRVASLYPDR